MSLEVRRVVYVPINVSNPGNLWRNGIQFLAAFLGVGL